MWELSSYVQTSELTSFPANRIEAGIVTGLSVLMLFIVPAILVRRLHNRLGWDRIWLSASLAIALSFMVIWLFFSVLQTLYISKHFELGTWGILEVLAWIFVNGLRMEIMYVFGMIVVGVFFHFWVMLREEKKGDPA